MKGLAAAVDDQDIRDKGQRDGCISIVYPLAIAKQRILNLISHIRRLLPSS